MRANGGAAGGLFTAWVGPRVARRREEAIRFSCAHCTSRVEAPARYAGTKLRCPFCFHVLDVPRESSPQRRGEEYALTDADTPPGKQASPCYLRIVCPVCETRMYATEDQLGQEMVCPDCGTATIVRRPVEPEVQDHPPIQRAEEYALYQGEGQPPTSDEVVYRAYIPVICRLCATRMLATEDQVGQEIVCPDCGTPARVPALASKPPDQAAADATQADFGSNYDPSQPAFAQGQISGGQGQVLITCDVCGTRIYAPVDQAGREILCPDCYSPLVIPEAAPNISAAPEPAEPVGEYGVGAPAERPPVVVPGFEPIVDDRPLRPLESRDDESSRQPPHCRTATREGATRWLASTARPVPGEPPSEPAEEPPIPRRASQDRERRLVMWRPFLVGVFDFPFSPTQQGTLLVFSVGAFVLSALTLEAVRLSRVPDTRTYFLAAALSGVTGLLGLAWIVLISSRCLSIIRQTGAGSEEAPFPSDLVWMDWVFQGLYVLFSLAIATLVGVAVGKALGALGWRSELGVPLSLFLLLPLVLLSMLEGESPLAPFSPGVWRSLFDAWRAWGLFYLQTLLLAGLTALFGWMALSVGQRVASVLGTLMGATLLAWAVMVYCRLLGRLAWCCAHT